MTPLSKSELRDTQLRILDIFAAECDAHGLDYFLYYGSLIGAVRHKGIIPWDDDIDLVMPRASYDKLKTLPWDKHDFELISPETSSSTPYLLTKLADRKTLLEENIGGAMASIGVNIDIFPLDNTDHPGPRSRRVLSMLRVLKSAQTVKAVRLSAQRSVAKNAILVMGKAALLLLSINRIVRMADRLAANAGENGAHASLLGPYGVREIMAPEWTAETIKLEFEGRMVAAPAGYHNILTTLYGDYMKLPPEDKRVTHHSFIAYKL